MQDATNVKRTPRACERCRQTRRRCLPPYPCRQCVAAGIPCDVRAKARPQRRAPQRKSSNEDDEVSPDRTASQNATGLAFIALQPAIAKRTVQTAQRGTFELLKSLVRDMLLERHGYTMDCMLNEPPSCSKTWTMDSSVSTTTQHDGGSPLPLDSTELYDLLTTFQHFIGWQDAKLVDIDKLHNVACACTKHLIDPSPDGMAEQVAEHHLPFDSVALVFVALALGAAATGQFHHAQSYFDISTEVVKHFASQPSMESCLVYYLQHVFALRAGTSNYQQALIAQAVQSAHDIGLQRDAHGVQGLKLYLLIYMADQYCSLTYDTDPIIRASNLHDQVFNPLGSAEPEFQTLISLVKMNGYVIEHLQRSHVLDQSSISEVEAKIGELCSQQTRSIPAHPSSGGFRTAYEPHARIHMLCCRLRLRAPGLLDKGTWLSSLCVCVHAAESVLSTYLLLYQPILLALARQHNGQSPPTAEPSTPVIFGMGATWRQVKRIMMSSFIIVFAYWHGELVHAEASRYMAMARLLLEYPRWRWGDKLDEALRTLLDMSSLSDFELDSHMRTLLPGVNEHFPRPLHGPIISSVTEHIAVQAPPAQQSFQTWPVMFEECSTNILLSPDISTIEQHTYFGVWDNFEFPLGGGV